MRLIKGHWSEESFYSEPREFFASLCMAIESAKKDIFLSFYIFEFDTIGRKIASLLASARRRGVVVRCLVDGFGSQESIVDLSLFFQKNRIDFAIYHPLPWHFFRFFRRKMSESGRFLRYWKKINRRSHKKLVVIDSDLAFVGGINISSDELEWVDFSVGLKGSCLSQLKEIFEFDWEQSESMNLRGPKVLASRIKSRRREVARRRASFFEEVGGAQRVWMTTGYLVPPRKIRSLLKKKKKEGADVRLIFSKQSDIPVHSWLSRAYLRQMFRLGVKICIYSEGFIHAKSILLDNSSIVGSSNLNYRSYLLDDELDVLVTQPSAVLEIENKFKELMADSEEVESLSQIRSNWYQNLIASLLNLYKKWM